MDTARAALTSSPITRSLPPGTGSSSASRAPSAKVLQTTATRVAMLPEDSKSTGSSAKAAEKTRLPQTKPTEPSEVMIAMVPWSHHLLKIGEVYVLGVACCSHVCIPTMYILEMTLNPEEIVLALASSESLEKLAARIRDNPSQYSTRDVRMR